jgi:transposase-like protein
MLCRRRHNIHLLRNSFRYASKKDWSAIAKDLKPVYTAASESDALDRFVEFSEKWEKRYPAIATCGRPGQVCRTLPETCLRAADICRNP